MYCFNALLCSVGDLGLQQFERVQGHGDVAGADRTEELVFLAGLHADGAGKLAQLAGILVLSRGLVLLVLVVLVVLDIMMPKMNGMDVLKELRRDSRLPVIMLTRGGLQTGLAE